jgi:hypothetical protein
MGITAPLAPVLTAPTAAGSLFTGHTYEVGISYENSSLLAESSMVNRTQITLTSPNLEISVAVVASTDPQVDTINVYARDITAGDSLLQLHGIYTNVTAAKVITIDDWEGQTDATLNNDLPVAMSFGCVWNNRWWGVDATVGYRLRFGQLFQAEAWPGTYFVDIPFIRGESITGILPLGSILCVFSWTTLYLITGTTLTDFTVTPALGAVAGAFGPRAIALIDSGVVHAGTVGVYLYNGSTDTHLSFLIDPGWRDFVQNSTAAALAAVGVIYSSFYKELHVAVSRLYPTGAYGEWILDCNRMNMPVPVGTLPNGPIWFSTPRTIQGYFQWDGNEVNAEDQGRLFSWSPSTVAIFEERTGLSANGADNSVEYDGFAAPFAMQVGRILTTFVQYQPCLGTLTVNLVVDGQQMGEQTFSLGSGFSFYGSAIYGTSLYEGGSARLTLPVTWPLQAEGHTAQLLFKYLGQDQFKLFSYGHEVVVEDIPRGL